jgi:hypothetical protein
MPPLLFFPPRCFHKTSLPQILLLPQMLPYPTREDKEEVAQAIDIFDIPLTGFLDPG